MKKTVEAWIVMRLDSYRFFEYAFKTRKAAKEWAVLAKWPESRIFKISWEKKP